MIWALLALLGVPLWLCAVGILALVLRNRSLRKRPGNLSVRVRAAGKHRWIRANSLWVSDVFVWRASPAAWVEHMNEITAVRARTATPEEHKKLHRLAADPVVAEMTTSGGATFDVAATADAGVALLSPRLRDVPEVDRATG